MYIKYGLHTRGGGRGLNSNKGSAQRHHRTGIEGEADRGGRGDWPSSHSLLNTRGGATCFLGSSLTETQEAIHNNRAVICVIYILCIDLSNATRRDVMLDKLTYAILPYLTQNLKQPIILWRAYNCVDDKCTSQVLGPVRPVRSYLRTGFACALVTPSPVTVTPKGRLLCATCRICTQKTFDPSRL